MKKFCFIVLLTCALAGRLLADARLMKYQPEKVANRHRSDYKLPFFNDGTKGKFAVVDLSSEVPCPALSEETVKHLGLPGNTLTSTISFYKFLEIYFREMEKMKNEKL